MQTADVESSNPGADRESRVRAELLRAYYGSLPGAFIGGAVTASFMAAVLYDKLPTDGAMPWLIAAYASCALRLVLWIRFREAAAANLSVAGWEWYAIASAALTGIVWGGSGLLLHVPGVLHDQIVVLLVTIGLAFTSTYLTSAYLPAYRAFVYPTFVLAAVPFLGSGDFSRLMIGLGTLAALPLVLRHARRLSLQLRASIEVRLENAELVAELRAQKKAAEDANVAKSRFLAVASHDLRQPLHALELFVQALEDLSLPGHAQQLVANVRRSVNSMEELFDSLLDISRLDAGVVGARIELISLAELLERLTFEYAAVAQRKGLSLQVVPTSLYVHSDPTLLVRILRNLVANAVRYTERGRVLIGCRRRGAQVSIEVWDTGPGIPTEKHAEVFQEFTQLGAPERDRRKGLGLGLAIVERLAQLLGHTVRLRSVVGKGSVFAVSVPRGRLEAEAILQEGAQVRTHFDLQGRLALLVDIGPREGQSELEQLLRGWHCEVIAAEPGEVRGLLGGVRRLPDLIIVAQPAGGENGAALVEMLRNEFNAEVPALLVGSGSAPLATEADALPVLNRPVNAARLRTLINNLLQTPAPRARRVG